MADDTDDTPETGEESADKPDEQAPAKQQDIPAEVKAALRKANKEAETLRLKLKEFEDRDKSEADKLAERLGVAEARALHADRLEIALEKGLSRSQAKRLVGSTREELEADAEELIADLGARPSTDDEKKDPPPGQQLRERLKPGNGDPDTPVEETDVKAIGERMFRH